MVDHDLFPSAPDQWERTTLGEICRQGGGSIQTGPFGSQLHASDYVPVGIPSIMPINIGDNRIVPSGIARIRESDAERLSKHRVKSGDIVYSRRGDVERRALVRESESGWLCGTGCLKVRFGEGVIDSAFASLYLGHPEIRAWIVRHAVGATMPNLNTAIMAAVPFLLPPIETQRCITHILGTLDDKIELNRQMNETLEGMARALFKSWFVDFDPVRAKLDGRQPPGMDAATAALFPDQFEHGELGLVPEGWTARTVGAEFNLTMGQSPPGSTYNEDSEGLPFFQGRRDFGFRFPSRRVFCTYPKRLADEGDTLVSVRAPVGDINIASERCCIGRGIAAVRHKSGSKSFTYYAMRELELDFARYEAEGTVFGSINKNNFKGLPALAPSVPVVAAFDRLVSPIDDRIKANAKQSSALAAIRDALLPKLLSGGLSVCSEEV